MSAPIIAYACQLGNRSPVQTDIRARPVIDRRSQLEDIAEAHRYLEAGQKRGNVNITVLPEAGR